MKRNQLPLLCFFLASMSMSSVQAETGRLFSSVRVSTESTQPVADEMPEEKIQNKHLQPTPQQVVYADQSIEIPVNYKLTVTEGSCATACNVLNELMPNGGEKSKFTILI